MLGLCKPPFYSVRLAPCQAVPLGSVGGDWEVEGERRDLLQTVSFQFSFCLLSVPVSIISSAALYQAAAVPSLLQLGLVCQFSRYLQKEIPPAQLPPPQPPTEASGMQRHLRCLSPYGLPPLPFQFLSFNNLFPCSSNATGGDSYFLQLLFLIS